MRFGSLFSGIGGLDLGLERAGMECEWMAESIPYARKVLSKRFPNALIVNDVRLVSGENFHDVDLICGGDPCQGNSNAGSVHKRTREDLASEFLRIVGEIRPRFVLRENPSVTRPDAPWPWNRFRTGLESLGYAVVPFRLRACCLGLDHRRDRLFLLAELPNSGSKRPQRFNRSGFQKGDTVREASCRVQESFRPIHGLSSPRICRGSDGIPNRVDRLTGLGNAVPPKMGEHIGRIILRNLHRPQDSTNNRMPHNVAGIEFDHADSLNVLKPIDSLI